eukprot:TRINITY_DN776_c0_g1_i1.p1 TRINITY_DN776_c0_g1~~TRINITY_DN776_c0_g1_i1.p1  ORF type:complete len:360 (+),score=92.81 TRINITY_DN776_c0_g1_i1:81-1082(+)
MASKSTMIIVKQGSLHQDKTSKNGVTKNMHMVVKNTPFCITVGSSDGKFDFSAAKMEASLLYDSEERKPVPYLQKLPLEYFTHLNATGTEVTIEFRVKILTSQYEGSLFLLKIDAINSKGTVTAISEPIKVVSKPEQIRRLKSNTPQVKAESLAPAKKRRRVSDEDSVDTSSTDVMEMLHAIRETQLRQMELMQHNLSMREQQEVCYSSEDFSPLDLPSDSMEVIDKPAPATLSLEQAFQQLIAAYNATDASERPSKIRRLIETDGDIASSLVAVATDLSSALPNTPLVKSDQQTESGQCQCAGCPFKKNIEQIDTFYSEFFSNPFENVEFAQ